MGIIGRIGKVIDHNIDKLVEVIVETRAKYNQKAYIYCASGEDSVPVKEDKILLVQVDGTGRNVMLGFLVPSQGAQPGEKIYFGRDQEGNIVSKIKLLNDGEYNLDTDTETTGEAKGKYFRKIKGETDILERKDRNYHNEKNVVTTVDENVDETIGGNQSKAIGGNEDRLIEGSRITHVNGNEDKAVGGNSNNNVSGVSNFTGSTINLN